MPRLAPLLLLLCAAACASPKPPQGPAVQHFGVMREVMMEGKTEPRTALAQYQHKGCCAVGALAGLAGEVMIDDGTVFLAHDRTGSIADRAGDAQATLLTVADVPGWRELPLADGADLDAIEQAIAAALPDPQAAAATPLPFLVIAPSAEVQVHVARGYCPHAASDPEHTPDVWHQTSASVRVVGFYAPGQAGVMTHHGTALHAHAMAMAAGATAMGHVDKLVVGAGARLLLPAR
jgi:hypothetical protein